MKKTDSKDWFRKKTWTKEDQDDFFANLNNAKSTHTKAQYLRIQALTLQKEVTPPDYKSSLEILEYLLTNFPDPNELPWVFLQRAMCLDALGQIDEAQTAYRKATKISPNPEGVHVTDAPIHFALFVLKHKKKALFNEVLNNFKGLDIVLLLPQVQFDFHVAMALFAEENNRGNDALEHAQKAFDLQTHVGDSHTIDPGLADRVSDIYSR